MALLVETSFLALVFALAGDRVALMVHAGAWMTALGFFVGAAWALSVERRSKP